MTTEVDKLLREYLDELRRRERDDEAGIKRAIGDLSNQVLLLGQKLDASFQLQNERLSGLAARIEKLEDAAEVTGNHNVEVLTKQLAESKKAHEKTWSYILAVIGGATILAATAIGTIVWSLIRGAK